MGKKILRILSPSVFKSLFFIKWCLKKSSLTAWDIFSPGKISCLILQPIIFKISILSASLINKQYLIVGRGAAKSLYDSCVQSYIENVDTSTTHQITTAPTMKLAEEVMSPIRTAIFEFHI